MTRRGAQLVGRRLAKSLPGLVLALLVLAAIYVALLAVPDPLFAHRERFGDFRVYSDAPIADDFGRVIEEAARRIAAMEHQSRRASPRVYLCSSRKRFAFFAFLTRKNPESLAIGLSVPNEVFVSMSRLRDFAAGNRGRLRHTRFEGRPAAAIAHEIAHFHSLYALGLRAHLALPVWKSEGWAEYQANVAALRHDPAYDLARRIDQLLDDSLWSEQATPHARAFWEWQLLVEFLAATKGYGLADLGKDEVTQAAVRKEMMAWHRSRSVPGPR